MNNNRVTVIDTAEQDVLATAVPLTVARRVVRGCVCGVDPQLNVEGGVAWLRDDLVLARIGGNSANGYELLHYDCLDHEARMTGGRK